MKFFKKKKSVTAIGQLVDLSMSDFKKYLKENNVNIGVMNTLIMSLNGAYYELKQRKEALMAMYTSDKTPAFQKKKIEKSIKGIYAELIKIEEKVVYLTETSKNLLDLDSSSNSEGEIDTKKD